MNENVNVSNIKVGRKDVDSYASSCLFKLTFSKEVRIRGLGEQTNKTSEIVKMLTDNIPYVGVKKSRQVFEKDSNGIEITLENVY